MLRGGLAVALLWAAFASKPLAAHAQRENLERGIALYHEGRILAASRALNAAESDPLPEPSDLVELHVYRGLIHVARGRHELARAEFARACALDSTLQRPAELGPASQASFNEVCPPAEVLTIEVALSREGILHATIRGDAYSIITQLRIRAEGDREWEFVHTASPEMSLEIPEEARRAENFVVDGLTTAGAVAFRVPVTRVESVSPLGIEIPNTIETEGSSALTIAVPTIAAEANTSPALESENTIEPWIWIVGSVLVVGAISGVIGGVLASEYQPTRVLAMPEVIP
jgi:hypothetical protein